jgi:penicillin-binding protein 2B
MEIMNKKVKIRTLAIGLLFSMLFVGLVSRLYWVQVVDAAVLEKKAEKNWQNEDIIPAQRGTILDRMGRSLAEDGAAYTISVNPKIIAGNKLDHEISHGLALILAANAGVDPTDLETRIYAMATKKKQDSNGFAIDVQVRPEGWKIDGETKLKVDELINAISLGHGIKAGNIGVNITDAQKRYYPSNSLAAQVLGYIDKEGKAVGGIESAFDSFLKGKPGKLNHEKDKKGVEIPDSKVSYTPPDIGKNVQLTIDKNIQFYMETALKKSMDQFHPKSMTAVAVNPKTMEILAMASAPTFDPNRYWEAKDPSDYNNRAISSRYEPGSTFKVVTLAGTVQEGLFNPNEIYQSGSINVHGSTLRDHNGGAGWGKIPFMDGLLYSSNVAFVKLGYEKLGPVKLKDYINRFGFGVKTGIELPNEIPGAIGEMKYPVEAATATYGQGQVGVTALQLTAAYAAIANGGKLMQPHIVKEIDDPQTKQAIQSFAPKVVKQAVTAETAHQTSLYLEQVVANQEKGTGRKAYLNGYRIAGKTGTAQIVEQGAKDYATGQYLISFVGYAPVEDPQILIAILSEEPDIGGDYHRGSEVWVPVFRDIMSQSLRYLGIPSSAATSNTMTEQPIKTIPDLSNASLSTAKAKLNQMGLQAQAFGSGGKILKQFPLPGTEISMNQEVYVTTDTTVQTVPDFKDKSLRDAMEICALLGIDCRTKGEGYVTSQATTGAGAEQIVSLELHALSDHVSAADNQASASSAASTNANSDGKTAVVPETTKPPKKTVKAAGAQKKP